MQLYSKMTVKNLYIVKEQHHFNITSVISRQTVDHFLVEYLFVFFLTFCFATATCGVSIFKCICGLDTASAWIGVGEVTMDTSAARHLEMYKNILKRH